MKLVHLLMYSARWLLLTALLASAVNGLLASRIVSLMNRSLDASGDEQRALGVEFFLLSLFALSFRWFSLAQFVRASQSTLARLRLHISQRIIRASYRDIESRGPARLLAVLSEDVGTVGECFMVLPWLFVHGVVIVGCLGHLLVLSWQAFSFMCLLLVLGSLGYMDGARKAQTGLRQARLEEDALFEHFRSLFAGAKELKLHQGRREAFLDGALSVSAERVRAARTAGLLRHTALGNWRVFLLFVVVGAVLFVTGPALGLGDEVRSGYALTLLYLMVPANSVLEAAPSLGRMHVALERIDDLTSVPQAEDGMGSATLPAFQSISLSHVTHQYQREDEERSFTLGPVRLDLRAGEIVFLVGGNGSGKTTLAKLITGLYQPESGQIGYNGRPLTASEQDAYRESFSAVFSDFHLFEQLVDPASTRGIADSRLDVSARALLEALRLDEKVRVTGGALSTTSLSSGQRKRLALLMAWLEDRPIYVFDEWAADQDPPYKEIFYRQILPDLRRRGKAVLVITHDDNYFSLADRCLKLEDGKLSDYRALPMQRLVAEAAFQIPSSEWAVSES